MSDGIRLSLATMRAVFPSAPDTILGAFVEKQGVLTAVGLNGSRQRLAYCFANLHAETGGFTIRNLTENINYTADRMAAVWPNRFANAAAVRGKYGNAPGWQLKAFDDIYGNRMGNRPGTSDGSRYIGRGGPQVTGRDGYAEIGKRIGVDLVSAPDLACNHALQPDIAAAFWDWKAMNKYADAGNFVGCVKAWNGGTNGLSERQAQLARITKVLQGAEFGAVADAPFKQNNAPAATTGPPEPIPAPTPQANNEPSKWAAFFSAIAKLFGGSK
ncbi:MAG: glycosyl hydrolase [Xanthobacteraceae bacterium]|nr:glycosyl hydrolase [Xanthobacteraceae bacterium]